MTLEDRIRVYQAGDKGQAERIHEQFGPLFDKLSRKYSFLAEFDDLRQECFLALCNALSGFDTEAGTAFMPYLWRTAERHLQRYGNNKGPLDALSLAEPIGEGLTLEDGLTDPTDRIEPIEDTESQRAAAEAIAGVIDELDPQERACVRARFVFGWTAAEIAEAAETTASKIHVIEARALRKLRRRKHKLLPWLDVYNISVHGTGAYSYQSTWTSSTERAAMLLWKYTP